MKIKTLLIAISCITALLFTSCEKGEMDQGQEEGKGGTGGGGKVDANISSIVKDTLTYPIDEKEYVIGNNTKENNYPDSLSITLIDMSTK